MKGSLQSHSCAHLLPHPQVSVGWDWALTRVTSSHGRHPSPPCPAAMWTWALCGVRRLKLQPQAKGERGCNTAGCTQRHGEAHIIRRPHLWAKIAVLWESGRRILAGSLEEVRFRGLYLESRDEQTVCTSGHWAVLTLTRACEAEVTWSSDWGTDGKAWWPVSTESCVGWEPGRAGPQPCHTQSWPWACLSRLTA